MPGQSQLTFWHDAPQINSRASFDHLGEYYMPFSTKAGYPGQHDCSGIPMLNYRGKIGLQYNPIAIAQWGMGNYNLHRQMQGSDPRDKFINASDWLCEILELNSQGLWVWNHHFDWEYRSTLRSPWYSGLAQGQGISLLVRAHAETGAARYLEAAKHAFQSFSIPTDQGGVSFTDENDDLWFEEYIVSPPTHVLNGFIWAIWGIHDYWLATGDASARELFTRAVKTLRTNLHRYDLGFWSLYEESGTRLPMLASAFYHRLHIVQLRVMHGLSGDKIFADYADRWEGYAQSPSRRTRALCYKGAFKLCHY